MKFLEEVDKKVFFSSGAVAILLIAWSYLSNDSFTHVFKTAFSFALNKFGWLYILFYTGIMVVLLAIAFSKYGKMKLGKQNEEPEFKLGLWLAMIFSAGQGVGLIFYGVAEPIDHYYNPVMSEPLSGNAMMEAIGQSTYHFGLQPWAGYAAIGLIIGYYQFRKGLPSLLSSGLYSFLGEKGIRSNFAKFIDGYTVILTLLGISASLSLASNQMSAGLASQFGLTNTTLNQFVILVIGTIIFTYTSSKGVSKGMAFLSNTNVKICYGLLLGLLVCGPTVFLLEYIVEGLGSFIVAFPRMSFFLDASNQVELKLGFDWIRSWTIFWWAFYLAWTPFVGIFVARISRGRTIKEFVLGALFLPTLFSHIWVAIFGGNAIYADIETGGAIGESVFGDVTTAIFALYEQLPFTQLFTVVSLFSISAFLLTSADSANFCISALTSKGLLNPPKMVRVFWGIIIGLFAGLFVLIGGIPGIQNLQFIIGLPFIFIMIFMFISFLKTLEQDHKIDFETE